MNILVFICLVSVAVGLASYFSIKSDNGFVGYILGLVVGALAALAQMAQMGAFE